MNLDRFEIDENHYKKLENMYYSAPCNQYFSPEMKISKGECIVTIPVTPKLFHAAGAAHGNAYFKVVDDSCFFAANSLITDVFVLTTNLNTHLTRPISSGEIKGIGKVVSVSKKQIIADSILYNSEGKQIGRGSCIFLKSKIPLTKEIGYKL